ncbi:MAG: hypothetical protein K2W80_00455 [Burkholderiales bacterium]|jgi:hypothetical protein|nr:hypothetical protein [Burkholderiales bacterium]
MNVDPTAHGPETLIGLGHPGPARWSTASFGMAADASPDDDASLGEHLSLCRTSNGRLFGLQCRVEATHAFLSGRVVTTLAAVLLTAAVAFIVS